MQVSDEVREKACDHMAQCLLKAGQTTPTVKIKAAVAGETDILCNNPTMSPTTYNLLAGAIVFSVSVPIVVCGSTGTLLISQYRQAIDVCFLPLLFSFY